MSARRSSQKLKRCTDKLKARDATIGRLREKLHNLEFMNHQFICSNESIDELNMLLKNKLLKMGVLPDEIPAIRSRPLSGLGLHPTSASIPSPDDDPDGPFAVGSDPSDDEDGSEDEGIVDEDGHGTDAGTLNPPPREHQQSTAAGPSHPTGHENMELRGGSQSLTRPKSLQDELAAAGDNDSDDDYEEEEKEEDEEERNEQQGGQKNEEEGEDRGTGVQGKLVKQDADGANSHVNDTRPDKSPFEDPTSDAHSSSSRKSLENISENDDEDGQTNTGIRLSALPKPSSSTSK